MNSEKVEEIKKALQDHSIEKLKYQDGIKIKELDFFDILTYINELESENERLNKSDTSKEKSSIEYYNLYRDFKRENQQLKAEIERLKEVIADQNELCWNCKKSVKEFAEKLKKRTILYSGINVKYEAITADIIDELLKEYIDEE